MNMGNIRVKRLDEKARLPAKAYQSDAGYDLYSLEDTFIGRGQTAVIRTGVAVAAPPGWWFLLHGRSSARARGLSVVTAVIDGGYRGEIYVAVWNITNDNLKVLAEERVAQLVPMPIGDFMIYETSSLPNSERGNHGFGSSGK